MCWLMSNLWTVFIENISSPMNSIRTVHSFNHQKLKQLAKEYVKKLLDYGPESAAYFVMFKVEENEKKTFNELVEGELNKRGIYNDSTETPRRC